MKPAEPDVSGARAIRRAAILIAYRGASEAAAKGAMFVVTVLAARRLSRDDFGLFALGTTIGWLAAVAADFGIQAHLARSVSQQPDRSAAMLRRWIPVRACTGAAAFGLSLVASSLLGLTGQPLEAVLLFTLSYAVSSVTECLYYFFRGIERTDVESTLTLAHRGSMVVLAFVVLEMQPGLVPLAVAMLGPALATLAAASVMAWRLAPENAAVSSSSTSESVTREFLASVVPIGIGVVLSALYFRIDIVLLERWNGTAAVAFYNAVFRIVDALRLFPAAVLAVALPLLCRASDLRPLRQIAGPLTAAACGAAAVLWIAAPALVPALYGPQFEPAVEPFRILLLSLPLMTFNYVLTTQLIGWHGHRAYAWLCSAALGCNLTINAALIPTLGAVGAAWATVWTEAMLGAGCLVALGSCANERRGQARPAPDAPVVETQR